MLPEYKSAVRARIAQAALKVFAKTGYHDSRMDDVAAEAGLSKPTLYEYVQSKEDLLKAISESSKESMVASLTIGVQGTREVLRRNYENLVASRGSLHLGFEIVSLSSHDETVGRINREVYTAKREALTSFLRRQQEGGTIGREIDPELAAQLLTSVYADVATQLTLGFDESEVRERWSKSVTAILGEHGERGSAQSPRRQAAAREAGSR